VAVSLYADAEPGAGVPLWRGTLSSTSAEATIPIGQEVSRAFTVEFDTAW